MNDKKEIEALKQLQHDYEEVFMGSPAGKRVLADLLAFTGVFELSFTVTEYDTQKTSFNEGKRSLGLKLLEALDQNSYAGLLKLEQDGVTDTKLARER